MSSSTEGENIIGVLKHWSKENKERKYNGDKV